MKIIIGGTIIEIDVRKMVQLVVHENNYWWYNNRNRCLQYGVVRNRYRDTIIVQIEMDVHENNYWRYNNGANRNSCL
jgi:hypothetical protein